MKTTLEIPDLVFRRAKARAAELGVPLRQFITAAVESRLAAPGGDPSRPWLECAGELAHLHEETLRMQKLIEDEFETIEPEDMA